MLDTATVDTFTPAVGDTFPLDLGESGKLSLELTAAKPLEVPEAALPEGVTPEPEEDRRAPFALTFRGPGDPLLPQGIYKLEHDSVGPLEIFLVPLGQTAEGTTYEAIFN